MSPPYYPLSLMVLDPSYQASVLYGSCLLPWRLQCTFCSVSTTQAHGPFPSSAPRLHRIISSENPSFSILLHPCSGSLTSQGPGGSTLCLPPPLPRSFYSSPPVWTPRCAPRPCSRLVGGISPIPLIHRFLSLSRGFPTSPSSAFRLLYKLGGRGVTGKSSST